MDHLCELPNDAARRKALNSLPPTLYATYERILQRVSNCNKDVQQLVQKSLRWLVCSEGPLSSLALCEAISIETGDTDLDRSAIPDVDEIFRWCSSLVRRSTAGDGLELAHFTVKEFLMACDDQRNREFDVYHFGPEIDDAELAEKCLTYLLFKHHASDEHTDFTTHYKHQFYTLRQYAVLFWPGHARKNLSKPAVSSLMGELLKPSKPHVFISWAKEWAREWEDWNSTRSDLAYAHFKHAELSTESPLHFASMLALPTCCEWLLQKRCYIDQISALGTPLQCALVGNDPWTGQKSFRIFADSRLATVKLLLGRGTDVNRVCNRQSPLHLALILRDKASCIELLRKGARMDSGTAKVLSSGETWDLAREIWKGMDTTRLQPEYRAILLDAALRFKGFSNDGSLEVSAYKSQDILHCDKVKLFMTAAEYGQIDVMEQIAQDCKFDLNSTGRWDQRSALHLAASNDHIDIVKFLVEHGADCTLVDSRGRTPLHTTTDKSIGSRCLEFLLSLNVGIDRGDQYGLTVWHLAALEGDIDALSILRGCVPNGTLQSHIKTNDGRTLLHCAGQSRSKKTLAYLIDHCNQSNIYDLTLDGFTALHCALKASSLDAVQYLIDRGFDTQVITSDGLSTLHCAVDVARDSEGVFDIIKLLLQSGVDPCNARSDGMTPIHLLLSRTQQDSKNQIKFSLSEFETLSREITKYATSLDSKFGAELSALHQVCRIPVGSSIEWRYIALRILLSERCRSRISRRYRQNRVDLPCRSLQERIH